MFFSMQDLCKGLVKQHDKGERDKHIQLQAEKDQILSRLGGYLNKNFQKETGNFMDTMTSHKDMRYYFDQRSELDRQNKYGDIIFEEKLNKNDDHELMIKLANTLSNHNINKIMDKNNQDADKIKQMLRVSIVRNQMAKEERVKAVMYKNNLLNPGTKLEEKDVMDILKGKPSSQVLNRRRSIDKENEKLRHRRSRMQMDDTDDHSLRTHRKKIKNPDMISIVDTNEATTTYSVFTNNMRNKSNFDETSMPSKTLISADSREASRDLSRKRAYNSGGYKKSRKRIKEHVLVNKGRDRFKNGKGEYIGHGQNPYYMNHAKYNKYGEDIMKSFKYKSPLQN